MKQFRITLSEGGGELFPAVFVEALALNSSLGILPDKIQLVTGNSVVIWVTQLKAEDVFQGGGD